MQRTSHTGADQTDEGIGTGPDLWSRRRILAGSGAVGLGLVAGCIGGEEQVGGGTGGGPSDGDSGGDGGTDPSDGGDGGSEPDDGGDTVPNDGTRRVGELIAGDLLHLSVEYVRPLQMVADLGAIPDTDEETRRYGDPKTIADFVEGGLADEADSLWAVGIAMKNVHERPVDVLQIELDSTGNTERYGSIESESQRLTYFTDATSLGRTLAPGEIRRGEAVFPLPDTPENYELKLQVFSVGREANDRFEVDLGSGSEATATIAQDPVAGAVGDTLQAGDYQVTLDSVEYVDSLLDTEHYRYGLRPGYRYLKLDLSASRTSETKNGGSFLLGVVDDDGYDFVWDETYKDALDPQRDQLRQFDVGDSIANTVFAFPIEEGWEPTYVTMTGYGPFENPPSDDRPDGVDRDLWRIA